MQRSSAASGRLQLPWTTKPGGLAHVPQRPARDAADGRDLAEAGLPDLGWYDLLWTAYRAPGRSLRVNELAREVAHRPR